MKKVLKEWVLPLAAEVLVILLFVKFVAFLIIVPSGSMLPTIQLHSCLVATRTYSPENSLERGDIIAFRSDELDKVLIKRVVGLPGDQVDIVEGKTYINGEYYEEPYVVYPSGETISFSVPEGCYLFLGDNRAGSSDARVWEEPYIPADKIIGEARFTLFPFSNFGFLR